MIASRTFSSHPQMAEEMCSPEMRAKLEASAKARRLIRELIFLRNKAGMSIPKVGRASGLGTGRVIEIERGEDRDITVNELAAYLSAVNQSL